MMVLADCTTLFGAAPRGGAEVAGDGCRAALLSEGGAVSRGKYEEKRY